MRYCFQTGRSRRYPGSRVRVSASGRLGSDIARHEGAPDSRQRGGVTVQSRERTLCCGDQGEESRREVCRNRRTRKVEEE